MKRFNTPDEVFAYFDGVLAQNVVAVSKSFAKVLPKWSQIETKLFFAIIERLEWRTSENGNIVVLSNRNLLKILDWKSSASLRQFSDYIFETLDKMKLSSNIKIKGLKHEDDNIDVSGCLFYHIEKNDDYTLIVFNPKFMPLLENLTKTKSYFTYWVSDVYKFKSKHAQNLYFEFIQKSKKFGTQIEEVNFTTRQLKNIFGLDKDAYMDANGFNRNKFETRTIDKATSEIRESKLIELIPYENGKYYKKTKKGRKVDRYEFKYRIRKEILDAPDGRYWFDREIFANQKKLNNKAKTELKQKGELIYKEPITLKDIEKFEAEELFVQEEFTEHDRNRIWEPCDEYDNFYF